LLNNRVFHNKQPLGCILKQAFVKEQPPGCTLRGPGSALGKT
jgi:hypothetical protein